MTSTSKKFLVLLLASLACSSAMARGTAAAAAAAAAAANPSAPAPATVYHTEDLQFYLPATTTSNSQFTEDFTLTLVNTMTTADKVTISVLADTSSQFTTGLDFVLYGVSGSTFTALSSTAAATKTAVGNSVLTSATFASSIYSTAYTSYILAVSGITKSPGADNFTITASNVATIQAVPEPESYAMLLAGLGLMGTIARRRSKKVS